MDIRDLLFSLKEKHETRLIVYLHVSSAIDVQLV